MALLSRQRRQWACWRFLELMFVWGLGFFASIPALAALWFLGPIEAAPPTYIGLPLMVLGQLVLGGIVLLAFGVVAWRKQVARCSGRTAGDRS